ncbi:MAG TPA: hypothetical protein PLH83_02425 [Ruminococcus sp.]|nr:hypothetical protein [Ruminococcus sp.]
MNKIVKKAMAAALALTIVGGGAPTLSGGGFDVLKPSIVANAEAMVTVANGAYFHKGDTLDFGTGSYVSVYDYEDSLFISGTQSFTNAEIIHGDEDTYGYIHIGNADVDCSLFPYADGNRDMLDSFEDVWGYIVCGDGTKESPYCFCPLLQELAAVTYSYASVTLEDSITLNFYADKPSLNALGVDSVTLTGPNGEKSYATFEEGGNDTYIFRYPLYATQLDEDVTIQYKKGEDIVQVRVYDEATNTLVPENSLSYNINTYCDEILEYEEGYYADEEINAVQSLKNLGIAAKNYFSDSTDEITFIGTNYTTDKDAIKADYAPTFQSENDKVSVVLDSVFSIRYYIDGLTADSTATDENDTVLNAVKGKGGKYCFEKKIVSPTDMGSPYTITYNSQDYIASALSWSYRTIENDSNRIRNLSRALYQYFKYTEIYETWANS